MDGQKITDVIQLAKYKVGHVLYWVTLRPIDSKAIVIPEGSEWMRRAHPKVFFDRKIMSKTFRGAAPKLCSIDFQYALGILTSELVVEEFKIKEIHRSSDTGEFYYSNEAGESMPESCLFKTAVAAKREKRRLRDLFKTWADRESKDEV